MNIPLDTAILVPLATTFFSVLAGFFLGVFRDRASASYKRKQEQLDDIKAACIELLSSCRKIFDVAVRRKDLSPEIREILQNLSTRLTGVTVIESGNQDPLSDQETEEYRAILVENFEKAVEAHVSLQIASPRLAESAHRLLRVSISPIGPRDYRDERAQYANVIHNFTTVARAVIYGARPKWHHRARRRVGDWWRIHVRHRLRRSKGAQGTD